MDKTDIPQPSDRDVFVSHSESSWESDSEAHSCADADKRRGDKFAARGRLLFETLLALPAVSASRIRNFGVWGLLGLMLIAVIFASEHCLIPLAFTPMRENNQATTIYKTNKRIWEVSRSLDAG